MRQILEKVKLPKLNITKEEYLAIKTLQDNTCIIILPTDKVNAIVVMDQLEYSEKLASLVENGSKVKKDPTSELKKAVKDQKYY